MGYLIFAILYLMVSVGMYLVLDTDKNMYLKLKLVVSILWPVFLGGSIARST